MRRNTCQWLGEAKARAISTLVLSALAVVLGIALSACAGGSHVTRTTTSAHAKAAAPPYVDIYAGLPLKGPMASQGRAILKGIKLALEHPGGLHIRFRTLNDSGQKTGDDNLALTAANAGKVARDPHAAYYIGDLGSAATAVSLPVLHAAGIAQITPGDPYIPAPAPDTATLAPRLLRLLPTYRVQAKADVLFFKDVVPHIRAGACTHVLAVAQDDPESIELVKLMYADAKADGIVMPEPSMLTSKENSLTLYQATVLAKQPRAQPPCGFVVAGSVSKQAVALTKLIHTTFPTAFILGTSGICSSKWTKAADGGVSASVDPVLWCTSPVLPVDQYADSDEFVKLYKSVYGASDPSPYALYGYEAADLGIGMINYAGGDGASRSAIRTNFFDSASFNLVFSPYASLAADGGSVLNSYGVYRVSPATAEPTFDTTLRP